MNDARTPPVTISVTAPFSPAIDRTGRILFRPFDIRKWFVLGFCAWLSWLGKGGGGVFNWEMPYNDSRSEVDMARDWVLENLGPVIFLGTVLALFIAGIVILLTWLSSRGKLMFLDGVILDRGAVVEPWNRFRERGNSLFGFRVVVGLIMLVAFAGLAGLMVHGMTALFGGEDPTLGALLVLCLGITLICGLAVGFALIGMAVNDFIVPIMWLRDCRVMEAWGEFRALLSSHGGTFVVYVLFRIALGLGLIFIACVATCFTCCIAALPYIGAVILLPLHVFRRCYSIGFLSQFGPEYSALRPTVEQP